MCAHRVIHEWKWSAVAPDWSADVAKLKVSGSGLSEKGFSQACAVCALSWAAVLLQGGWWCRLLGWTIACSSLHILLDDPALPLKACS